MSFRQALLLNLQCPLVIVLSLLNILPLKTEGPHHTEAFRSLGVMSPQSFLANLKGSKAERASFIILFQLQIKTGQVGQGRSDVWMLRSQEFLVACQRLEQG